VVVMEAVKAGVPWNAMVAAVLMFHAVAPNAA
jgi:hypothetical protein